MDVMALLKNRDTGTMGHEDKFLIYHYLQKIILGYAVFAEGEPFETAFAEEVALLKEMAAHTQYSALLYAWADNGRERLAAALRAPPLSGRLADWKSMDLESRGALLQDIIGLQARLYEIKPCTFLAPALTLIDSNVSTDAVVAVPTRIESIDAAAVPVSLNRRMLGEDTPQAALLFAHHETLHHFTLQLAMAAHENRIPDNHPLYQDSLLRLARLKSRGHAYAEIKAVYECDGEENFAYDQQGRLYRELYGPPPCAQTPAPSPGL